MFIDRHPPGLRVLCIAVAGHAFAWYTVYNLFALYLLSVGMTPAAATSAFGWLVVAAYLLPLVGAVVSDGGSVAVPWLRWREEQQQVVSPYTFGHRVGSVYLEERRLWWHAVITRRLCFRPRTITIPALGPLRTAAAGAALATVGYGLFASGIVPTLVALAVLTLGVGLSKPTLSTMVGRLFPESGAANNPAADAAYARYYSWLNGGSLVAPLLGGVVVASISGTAGYRAAFALAVVGELVVLSALLLGRRHLAGTAQSSPLAAIGVEDSAALAHDVDAQPTPDRRRLRALHIFLILAAVAFWPAYNQNGSGLSVWAELHTERTVSVAGHLYTIPAVWFAMVNSVLCVVGAGVVMWLFSRQRLSTAATVGYVAMALSFLTLILAPQLRAHPLYLVAAVALSTFSEILISTLGMARVSALAPRSQATKYMALWYLTVACGGWLAGRVGQLPLRQGFCVFAAVAAAGAAAAWLLRRRLDVGEAVQVQQVRLTRDVGYGVLKRGEVLDVAEVYGESEDDAATGWWCRRRGDRDGRQHLVLSGEAVAV